MCTKDAILYSLNMADQATLRSLATMEDAALTFPTENGGCHPLWVVWTPGLRRGTHARDAGRQRQSGGALGRDFRAGHGSHRGCGGYPTFAQVRPDMWSLESTICSFSRR